MIKKRKNKRGLSVVIGYVLLITFGIILSVIVYNYLKTYVPSEVTQCPAGVSIFLKDYTCSNNQLNITLKNNGKFYLDGYFIHATNSSTSSLATVNLAKYFSPNNYEGRNSSTAVYFYVDSNKNLYPSYNSYAIFDLPNQVYSIEIIPARFQKEGNVQRFVSCGDAKIREVITCS
ncbi:hypothetical protein GW931_03690 [archaeon]|nr:hypothetical protein [archaeon]PJC45676.1 MAG: hypothetical protein CO037_00320 [Candidatus Pacearchaeota archaeon CG_4_9_14_0_2_um_filter_30_8]